MSHLNYLLHEPRALQAKSPEGNTTKCGQRRTDRCGNAVAAKSYKRCLRRLRDTAYKRPRNYSELRQRFYHFEKKHNTHARDPLFQASRCPLAQISASQQARGAGQGSRTAMTRGERRPPTILKNKKRKHNTHARVSSSV